MSLSEKGKRGTRIGRSRPGLLLLRPISLILGRRIKHIKVLLAVRPDLENTRHVATAVAIVGRGPDGREFVVVEDREAFHAELVRAEDVDHVVRVEELVDDLGAKSVARASAHKEDAASSVREGRKGAGSGNGSFLPLPLTHRGDIENSSLSGSGSDQTRSAIGPSCGISGPRHKRDGVSQKKKKKKGVIPSTRKKGSPRKRSMILI